MSVKTKAYPEKMLRMYGKGRSDNGYLRLYGGYLRDILENLDYDNIRLVADCFLDARKRSASIFFVGNGGSAATASHFAQDLGELGRKAGKDGFKTHCLSDSISSITAIANDYGYEHIFSGQMKELFKKGDVLVAISASGNSPNVVKAVEYAGKAGGVTVALVGFDGGRLAKLCDHVLHVKTGKGEYGPVEDIHMALDHMITTYIMMRDAEGKAALKGE